jgi:23S rRNA pseudouridine1911/1915/1917 synthase
VGTDRGGDATVLSVVGPQLRGGSRLFPCHRLDRGTSGVLLLPRSPEVQQFFFSHWAEVTKIYVAVVQGRIDKDQGTITDALYEQPGSLHVMVSSRPEAREAVTHWRVLQRGARATLVELRIETGRKHQIGVHMQHLGHPVLGDDRYASAGGAPARKVPRLCLHARTLSFPHPMTGAILHFDTTVPTLFAELAAG